MPEPSMIQCSCSACDFNACLMKQHTNAQVFNHSLAAKLYDLNSFTDFDVCNEWDKNNIDTLKEESIDDYAKDEVFENLIEALSVIESCEDDSKVESGQILNKTITNSLAKLNLSTAKLSARVMNVPFKDFESSVFPQKQNVISENKEFKLSSFDLFQKIKEVYNACSCKVCECIAGKPQQKASCGCRPCECDDCNSLKKILSLGHVPESFRNVDIVPPLTKESCKKILKSTPQHGCKCIPCECVKCVDRSKGPCACKPCECIECSPTKLAHEHQKLVIAAVGNNNEFHQQCTCSPCECLECSQRFGTSSNVVRREIATSTNRHLLCNCDTCMSEACGPDDNDNCSCERREKVVRKPVQRENTDFDIRSTFVTQNMKQDIVDQRDMIALFAAVSNRNPYNRTQRKECSCGNCECLYCDYKEDAINTGALNIFNSSNSKIHYNMKRKNPPNVFKYNAKDSSLNPCNCGKCECLICGKLSKVTKKLHPIQNFKSVNQKKVISKAVTCKCVDPCECTYCDAMDTCTGDICNCMNCKCIHCGSDEVVYPVKKSETLTPLIYENKLKRSFTTITNDDKRNEFEMLSKNLPHPSFKNYGMKFQGDVLINESGQCNLQTSNSSNNASNHFPKNINEKLKREKYCHLIDISKLSANLINKVTNRALKDFQQASTCNVSVNSSISNFKNSESYPQSEDRSKSQGSSCNSSGRDNSNYLVQFPGKGTTIDTHNLENVSKQNQIAKLGIISSDFVKQSAKALDGEQASDKSEYERVKEEYLSYDECCLARSDSFTLKIKDLNVSNQFSVKKIENSNQKLQYTSNPIQIKRSKENRNIKIESDNSNFSKCLEKAHIGDNIDKRDVDSTTQINFSLRGNYKRIQKALNDARDFSLELANILGKYEKANRDFESISKKIKQHSNMHVATLDVPKAMSRISKNKLTTESSKHLTRNKPNSTKNKHTSSENHERFVYDENTVSSAELQSKGSNFKEHSRQPHKNKCNDNKDINSKLKLKLERQKSKDLGFSSSDSDKSDEEKIHEENSYTADDKNESLNDQMDFSAKGRNWKKQKLNKASRQSVNASKRNRKRKKNVAKAITITTGTSYHDLKIHTNESYSQSDGLSSPEVNRRLENQNSHMVQVDTPVGDINNLDATTRKAKYEQYRLTKNQSVTMVKLPTEPELEKRPNETKPWPILKKSFVTTDDKKLKSLEQAIKDTVSAIKEASASWHANLDARRQEETLLKLHSDVKKLLELPIIRKPETQPTMKDLQCNVKKITFQTVQDVINYEDDGQDPKEIMVDNYFEALKVSCIGARKVSSHTIMVRWNAPKVLDQVQGYELQVDGRTVKKIFNVDRCMAVIGGIPKLDKILLTVRTVTALPCASGYNPSSTIIFRP